MTKKNYWIAFGLTAILIVVPSVLSAAGAAHQPGSFRGSKFPGSAVQTFFYIWFVGVVVWLLAIAVMARLRFRGNRATASGVLTGILLGALALLGSCIKNFDTFSDKF